MKNRNVIYFALGSVLVILLLNFSLISAESEKIPSWVKKIAKFWSDGITEDAEFVNALQYLIDKKIISVQDSIRAPHIVILTDKQQYKVGESINITVTNIGADRAVFGGYPVIIIGSQPDGTCAFFCSKREIETYLPPNSSIKYTWNQIGGESNSQVKTGGYLIYAEYFEENHQNVFPNYYETRKEFEIVN